MLNGNVGFQKLLDIVLHLLVTPSGTKALSGWFQTRWSAVREELDACASVREVDAFIATYANSLAEDLVALVAEQVDFETELAAIDFFEELCRPISMVGVNRFIQPLRVMEDRKQSHYFNVCAGLCSQPQAVCFDTFPVRGSVQRVRSESKPVG